MSVLAAACLLTGAGCAGRPAESSGTESGVYYAFTDDAGREVVLPEAPQKVAVLFSSFADIWKTAGGTVNITVGESVGRGFADESAVLVDAGAGKTINTESLIAAEPDLIIGSLDIAAQADAVKLAAQAGFPAAAFKVESFADYLRVLKICTDITGDAEAYETYGTAVQGRVDEVLQKAQQSGQVQPREILFIRAGSKASQNGEGPFRVRHAAGDGNPQHRRRRAGAAGRTEPGGNPAAQSRLYFHQYHGGRAGGHRLP